MKNFFRLAVTPFYFRCDKIVYTKLEGLAIGASFAVKCANFWTKSLKKSTNTPNEGGKNKFWDMEGTFLIVIDALFSMGMESSANYAKSVFMLKATVLLTLSIKICKKMYWCVPIVQKKVKQRTQELKMFRRYVVDIVFIAKGNPREYLGVFKFFKNYIIINKKVNNDR